MDDKITIIFEERQEQDINIQEVIKFQNGGVKLSLDKTNGVLSLLNKNNVVLSTVDFPTEKIITNIRYDNQTQELVFEFESFEDIRVPIKTDISNFYTIQEIDNILNNIKIEFNNSIDNINKQLLLKEDKSNLKALAYKDSLNKNDIGLGNVLNVESYPKQETYSKTEIDSINSKKVDKIQGKGLSTNDLTNELLSKLNSLSNYDDTNIQSQIDGIKRVLTSDDVDYDTLQELVNALKNNTSSIGDIFTELSKKANSADVYTKGEVDDALVEYTHQADFNQTIEGIRDDLDSKANKSELFSKDYNDLSNKPDIPTKLSDLEIDIEVGGGDGVSEEEVMVIVNENSEEVDELEIEEVEDLGVEEITTLTLATSTNYDINSDEQIITPKAVKNIIENSSSNYDDTEIKQDILDLENNKADKNELFSKNYNDLTNKPTIPSTTNQLTNNSGFITNVVSDLVNYYLKADTYSKTEIDNLVTSIPKFNIKVVTSLPTTNISTTTVYLKTIGNESSNLYEEFVYVDGLWEKLGTQTVDLTNYALKSSIPTKLSQLTNDNLYVDENKVEEILETNSKEVTSIDIGTSTNLDITNDNQVPTSLAVKNYIESKLGDIEAILDILNGEV